MFDENDYVMNLFTEMIGVVLGTCITVFVIDRLREYRERENLKLRLIREVGSGSNEFAKNAVSWLRAEGWLEGDDGLLKGKVLNWADLRGAFLRKANLHKVQLIEANLQEANLQCANLQEAWLIDAEMQGAKLQGADLRKAELEDAELEGAILPDATKYTDNTDMERFTDSDHAMYKMTLKSINFYRGILGVKRLRV